MSDEIRRIMGYEVISSVQVGRNEIIFAENTTKSEPYLVCDSNWNSLFGIDIFNDAIASDDYLDVMSIFTERIDRELQKIANQRIERGISHIPFTTADCIENSLFGHYENQLVVIRAEKMTPSARTADNQILLATGGNGCNPEARGLAVFCKNLFTGENTRWERYDVAGILHPDRVPAWAKEKLAEMNYLKTAEMSTEQNYNQLDGIINNTAQPKADLTDGQSLEEIKELAPETLAKSEKPSVIGQLKETKEAPKKPHVGSKKKPTEPML